MQEKIHLKGLNGLRAIAAISVVLSHVALPGITLHYNIPFASLAQYGVTIFFTLSGFLITFLLFKEKIKTGVNIKKFYIRRILRIWPLYFAYLLLVIAISFITDQGKLPALLPWYLFFAANVPALLHVYIPFLSHYWTLGVEEQFYIFWPWIIKRSGRVLKALIIFTVCFFALKIFFRFIYFQWGNITPLFIININRFECMSIGGVAALLCLQGHRSFLQITTHRITDIICWLCLGVMCVNKFYITPLLDHDIAALVTVGLIVNQSFSKKPLINLENRVFDLLGKLSYGIYIIHPLIIYYYYLLLSLFKIEYLTKVIVFYAGSVLITIFIAWLSYEFFEKRFLRMKDRFSVVKSSDSKYT